MPRRLGQHFLADRRALARIADALQLDRNKLVIEVGAGRGALTSVLCERAAKVVAIELDATLAAFLRQKFAPRPADPGGGCLVEVIEADVLSLTFASLPARYGFERGRVAGNLPYYITSPILMRLFEASHVLDRIVVLVQLEVAHRLVSPPGSRDYGLLSVTTQYFARPELLFRVAPGAFRPPPAVMSAVVRLTVQPRGAELGIDDDARFLKFVAACFAQKRKTLVNNLRGRYDPLQVADILGSLGAGASARAEALNGDQFAALYKGLGARG